LSRASVHLDCGKNLQRWRRVPSMAQSATMILLSTVKQPQQIGPWFGVRAWGGPSLFPSPMRGVWRAEMTRDLDYSQILPSVCPGVTLGLWVRRTCTGCVSPTGAPLAVSVRFRVSRCPDDAGPNSPHRLLRGPLGGGVTSPTRKYRIPPHRCDVSRGRPSLDGTMGI
jgi:hypothetical protein